MRVAGGRTATRLGRQVRRAAKMALKGGQRGPSEALTGYSGPARVCRLIWQPTWSPDWGENNQAKGFAGVCIKPLRMGPQRRRRSIMMIISRARAAPTGLPSDSLEPGPWGRADGRPDAVPGPR